MIKRIFPALGLIGSLLFFGCAATSFTSTWRDPAFASNAPKKVAVIAVLHDNTLRRRVEDSFVAQLRTLGIDGVPGHSFLQDQKPDKAELIDAVNRVGADLVIVISVVDKQTSETYVPATQSTSRSAEPGMYGYYSTRWDTTYTPGYTVTTHSAISESKAFDVKEQKLVWSGTAATVIDGAVTDAMVNEFSKKVTEKIFKGRQKA